MMVIMIMAKKFAFITTVMAPLMRISMIMMIMVGMTMRMKVKMLMIMMPRMISDSNCVYVHNERHNDDGGDDDDDNEGIGV
jgi:hypothetical protein